MEPLRLLLGKGINLEARMEGDTYAVSLLQMAVDECTAPHVRLLLEAGADSSAGFRQGAYLNMQRDSEGDSMLDVAVNRVSDWGAPSYKSASLEIIVALLSSPGAGALISRQAAGYTALYLLTRLRCATPSASCDYAELLLRHGAPVNPLNDEGKTPLDVAEAKGNAAYAFYLRGRGGLPGPGVGDEDESDDDGDGDDDAAEDNDDEDE